MSPDSFRGHWCWTFHSLRGTQKNSLFSSHLADGYCKVAQIIAKYCGGLAHTWSIYYYYYFRSFFVNIFRDDECALFGGYMRIMSKVTEINGTNDQVIKKRGYLGMYNRPGWIVGEEGSNVFYIHG